MPEVDCTTGIVGQGPDRYRAVLDYARAKRGRPKKGETAAGTSTKSLRLTEAEWSLLEKRAKRQAEGLINRPPVATERMPIAPADPAASHGHDDRRPQSNSRHPWAWLLKRVFQRDVTVCPRCQGRLTIREVARTTDAIARILARHGLGPQPPPPSPPKWVDPTQASLRFT
jgi:hypothetical protein